MLNTYKCNTYSDFNDNYNLSPQKSSLAVKILGVIYSFMRIGILGAGISGLSVGRLLQDKFDVEILEASSEIGGIAKTRKVKGYTYHPIGGHCFNSKYPQVLDFVFNTILERENWNTIDRKAVIKLRDYLVNYPIEYSVKQIAAFDPDLALAITSDFLNTKPSAEFLNLEDWFRKKFGDTLTDIYFLPYNRKIWNTEPKDMDPQWVEGKLPVPDKKSFFRGLLGSETDKMPHRSFYYPATNDQNTFIESLASSLTISKNYQVKQITFDTRSNKWIVNSDKEYDVLISTIPLNLLPGIVQNTPKKIKEQALSLKYNKITTMLWTSKPVQFTWSYIPSEESIFHRYIHIGNYCIPSKDITITEAIGSRSYEEMSSEGKKDPFLLEPLDYNVSDHAYVIFDANYKTATSDIKQHFSSLGIYLLGRFGEWDYYNMDECIKRSIEISEEITKQFRE